MRILLWLSNILIGISILLIIANIIAYFMGMGTAYNFGDPTKYEFILVPFWQIGLAALIAGLIARHLVRRLLQLNE